MGFVNKAMTARKDGHLHLIVIPYTSYMVIITAPYAIEIGKKKIRKYTINLNTYRNLHYQINNNLKARYKDLIQEQISHLRFNYIKKIYFTIFYSDKRDRDKSNFCCIHEKYFCDALVEVGAIVDDNDYYIGESTYIYGGIDKDNPRCEIRIIE